MISTRIEQRLSQIAASWNHTRVELETDEGLRSPNTSGCEDFELAAALGSEMKGFSRG